jgi:hypothetical protein
VVVDWALAQLDATDDGFDAFCDLWDSGAGPFGL